jgi:hypothetical protein
MFVTFRNWAWGIISPSENLQEHRKKLSQSRISNLEVILDTFLKAVLWDILSIEHLLIGRLSNF